MLFIKLYIYQKILKNKVYHYFHTKYEAAKKINIDNNQKCFLSQINCNYF